MEFARTCVIVINFWGASETRKCINSVLNSNTRTQIVVVDNSPNDPALSDFETDFGVQVLRPAANLGFGRGCNLGICWALANTSSEYILLLNNDATVLVDTINVLEEHLDRDQASGVAAPRIVFAHDTARLWYGGGDLDWKRGSAVVPGFGGATDAPLARKARYVSFASGCAMLIRRKVLEAIGGFDPRLFMYEEDVELCIRVCAHEMRIRYVPDAVVEHKCQGSTRSETEPRLDFWDIRGTQLGFYAFHIIRNRLLNMHRHARGLNLARFAIFFPLYILRRAVPFIMAGRFDAVRQLVRALRSFWCDRNTPYLNELTR